jgi:ribosomal protein S18 acetylase RimI-like enzyme
VRSDPEPTGLDYLATVTALLQRARLADPVAGVWEAADLQWWWRRDQHPEPGRARFWYDEAGPVVGAVLTRWRSVTAVDVLGDVTRKEAWAWLTDRVDTLEGEAVEASVVADDLTVRARWERLGFTQEGPPYLSLRRGTIAPDGGVLPGGYLIASRADDDRALHWLADRNGAHVEHRLRECSIYDPTCDLAILTESGEVAGYVLGWPDSVTHLGLVEPVRIAEAHAGRGLATAAVSEVCRRLAERGCTRQKIGVEVGNVAAHRAYVKAGFADPRAETTLRPPTTSD